MRENEFRSLRFFYIWDSDLYNYHYRYSIFYSYSVISCWRRRLYLHAAVTQALYSYRRLHKSCAPLLRTPIRLHPLTRSADRVTYRLCGRIYSSQSLSDPSFSLFQVSEHHTDRSRLGRVTTGYLCDALEMVWRRRQNIVECFLPLLSGVPRLWFDRYECKASRVPASTSTLSSSCVTRLSNSRTRTAWKTSHTRNRVFVIIRLTGVWNLFLRTRINARSVVMSYARRDYFRSFGAVFERIF